MADHGPIQTSAVIVLAGGPKSPAAPPPSPPTPCESPPPPPRSRRHHHHRRHDDDDDYYDDDYCVEQGGTGDDDDADADADADKTDDGLPDLEDLGGLSERRLARGLHVLATEAAALAHVARLYADDAAARSGFDRAVAAMVARSAGGGKLVVVGVGKSGLIGRKMTATLQSLGLPAVFLHPTEALHGDLGLVSPRDALLFITFSGATRELLLLLPHLPDALPAIVLTSHTRADACELLRRRPAAILVPAPLRQPERASFGVDAPSTSTTVALALCDALAMAAASELHDNLPAEFARNHPGGAIGARQSPVPAVARRDMT